MIIDIDSHFEPGPEWLDPFPSLAARLPVPHPGISAVDAIVGDLLRRVPESEWPPIEELAPPGMAILFDREKAGEAGRRAEFAGRNQREIANAAARVKWLDQQGIDVQNVICLAGLAYKATLERKDPRLLQEVLHACNTWLAETCAPACGRLLPVTTPDYSDLDHAIAELTRMRACGSRIFLIPGHPVNGVPPCHPSWDRLWSAATDLGMTPMLHVGFQRMDYDPGWANLGVNVSMMRRFASSMGHCGAQLLIYSFIYTGLFERHPKLTLLLAELGVGWMPWFWRELDGRVGPVSDLFLGDYELPLRPSEYFARNVRGTPLSWAKDQPLPEVMRGLPDDVVVFSSDFPHFEGYTDPMGVYRDQLEGFSRERLERFYGGSMAEVYARMGDPIA